jgi:signal transduction histidine kinase
VSRIDLGTLASEPVSLDLADLADSVVGELMPQISERKIKLTKEYARPLTFMADPKLMRILIQNLLSNAVKYTPPEGSIAASLILDKKSLHLKVADTGYGIPAAQQGKIFTKLFRADNAKEKEQDGNGLGLYIIKSIVESNGGKIWFESQENKGTTFYIDLPASGMKKIEGSRTLG